MIWPLIQKEIKTNCLIFLLILLIITMYGTIIVMMYDPHLGESLLMMAESMPQLFAAFGMSQPGLHLLDFIFNYLYGFILIAIPFIYIIIMCQRLMIRYIDQGSLAYLLATPHSRKQLFFSQLFVMFLGLLLMIIYETLLIVICSYVMFQEIVDIGQLLIVNLGLLSLQSLMMAMCYLSACFFQDTKLSLGVGSGMGILFILIHMLSQVSDKIEWLHYLTPLSLFDVHSLAQYNSIESIIILFLLTLIMFIIALKVFQKRDFAV